MLRTSTLLFILTLANAVTAAEKPNIIVIYADDMGYGDCTANNPESKIPTPNIDRLANEGLRFTDAHSPASTCTASRYVLLTGVNPARRGVLNGLTSLGPVIDKDEVTVADLLKDRRRQRRSEAASSHGRCAQPDARSTEIVQQAACIPRTADTRTATEVKRDSAE